MSTGRVEGKVAFITGAARGQGRSHAVRLAEEGADIIALDNCATIDTAGYAGATEEDLQETVRLVEALGRQIIATQGDVRDAAVVKAAVEDGVARLGRLDVAIANAGIAGTAPIESLSEDMWQNLIDINLTGVFHTAKAAVPHLGEGGSLIFISSIAGVKGLPNNAHYTAAKHGVIGLMRALGNELAPRMIRVNAILPTNVDTDMLLNESIYRLFAPDSPNPSKEDVLPLFASLNAMPIPYVNAIDVSNAVLWLASDEARYVTGVALPIDAGSTIR